MISQKFISRILSFFRAVQMDDPRGIKNLNPGNIRISNQNWLGKVPLDQNTDGTFEQFTDPKYGLRAIAVLIRNYYHIYGLDTLKGIINKWAPANENNVDSYLDYVCKSCGVSAPDFYDVTNDYKLALLICAIVQFENGVQPYSQSIINEAISLV